MTGAATERTVERRVAGRWSARLYYRSLNFQTLIFLFDLNILFFSPWISILGWSRDEASQQRFGAFAAKRSQGTIVTWGQWMQVSHTGALAFLVNQGQHERSKLRAKLFWLESRVEHNPPLEWWCIRRSSHAQCVDGRPGLSTCCYRCAVCTCMGLGFRLSVNVICGVHVWALDFFSSEARISPPCYLFKNAWAGQL